VVDHLVVPVEQQLIGERVVVEGLVVEPVQQIDKVGEQ
jgi:hypothetical protein